MGACPWKTIVIGFAIRWLSVAVGPVVSRDPCSHAPDLAVRGFAGGYPHRFELTGDLRAGTLRRFISEPRETLLQNKDIVGGSTVKTYYAKPGEVEREWLLIDATDLTLGRLATKVATLLKGKHKPQYTPHVDTGDFVVVTNASKIKLTGTKAADKVYYHHTGYVGGLKSETFAEAMAKHPELVVERAVKGMLPKNTLGRAQGMKLKVYAGPEHPHAAQNPREIKLED